jgi:hypothetical protein
MIPRRKVVSDNSKPVLRTRPSIPQSDSYDPIPLVVVNEDSIAVAEEDLVPANSEESFEAVAPGQEEFVVEMAIEDHCNGEVVEVKLSDKLVINADSLGIKNSQYSSDYLVESPGFHNVGTPDQLVERLALVGYQCLEFLAFQMSLLLNTPTTKIRALLLEGPSGCGKTYMAKSLAKIVGAELMCLSCYQGMLTQNLIEYPSTLAMANAMTGKGEA